MQRLLTAAILAPPFLASMLLGPTWVFMSMVTAGVLLAAWEYTRIALPEEPRHPAAATLPAKERPGRGLLGMLPILVIPFAWGLREAMTEGRGVAALAAVVAIALPVAVLAARTSLEHGFRTVGAFAFGLPYFALPVLAAWELRESDPWLVFLAFAIAWLGDTGAYYVGRPFGRHKMAPRVSPKKSWEGAAAALAVSLAVALLWCHFRLGEIRPVLLGLAVVTSVAAQIGDLAESMFKRGSGVKDSGTLLPGHGGLWDRVDGVLFALPVLWLAVLWLDPALLSP
ncbi:MAG: phosphatidate cytidylyltransferase [Acidobacteriota bacterium]